MIYPHMEWSQEVVFSASEEWFTSHDAPCITQCHCIDDVLYCPKYFTVVRYTLYIISPNKMNMYIFH